MKDETIGEFIDSHWDILKGKDRMEQYKYLESHDIGLTRGLKNILLKRKENNRENCNDCPHKINLRCTTQHPCPESMPRLVLVKSRMKVSALRR